MTKNTAEKNGRPQSEENQRKEAICARYTGAMSSGSGASSFLMTAHPGYNRIQHPSMCDIAIFDKMV